MKRLQLYLYLYPQNLDYYSSIFVISGTSRNSTVYRRQAGIIRFRGADSRFGLHGIFERDRQ